MWGHLWEFGLRVSSVVVGMEIHSRYQKQISGLASPWFSKAEKMFK